MTVSSSSNGASAARRPIHTRNPYQPVGDYISNVSRFKIIESTLREGEQFANAFFDTETKIKIARALDDFGVDYIELTSPAASEQSRRDCEAICKLGLKAKILTHVRCTMEDARIAVETGVDGLDVVIGTSQFLREFSHGKDMAYITKSAIEVINFIKSKGLEVRFSSEDSFRSDLVDLLSLYRTVDMVGVNRVGIADTVGCATPRQVYDLVRTLRGVVSCDIEIHLHNDTGCAIANAYCALEAGATHIDTSVLGIGERNGITTLGGLMARMIVADRDYVTKKYKLHKLKDLEDLVAEAVQVNTPFNNPITGFCAFTHKAGIHAKAILNNPSTYEIINPADFGLTRYVHFASRLTGWNAVKTRVGQLGLSMTDEQVKIVTQKIKALADVRPIAIDDADSIIRTFHLSLVGDDVAPADAPNLPQKEKHINGGTGVSAVEEDVTVPSSEPTHGEGGQDTVGVDNTGCIAPTADEATIITPANNLLVTTDGTNIPVTASIPMTSDDGQTQTETPEVTVTAAPIPDMNNSSPEATPEAETNGKMEEGKETATPNPTTGDDQDDGQNKNNHIAVSNEQEPKRISEPDHKGAQTPIETGNDNNETSTTQTTTEQEDDTPTTPVMSSAQTSSFTTPTSEHEPKTPSLTEDSIVLISIPDDEKDLVPQIDAKPDHPYPIPSLPNLNEEIITIDTHPPAIMEPNTLPAIKSSTPDGNIDNNKPKESHAASTAGDAVLFTSQVGHVEKANNNVPPVSGAGIEKIVATVPVVAVEDGNTILF